MSEATATMEKRNKAINAARALITEAAEQGRTLTADEETTIRNAMADFDAEHAKLENQRKDETKPLPIGADGGARQPVTRSEANAAVREWALGEGTSTITLDTSRAAHHHIHRSVRQRGLERRDLSTSQTSGDAGYTVDEMLANELYDYRETVSGFRSTMPRVVNTMGGGNFNWPKVLTHGAATATAEGAVIGGTDPTFGEVTLTDHKFTQILNVTSEILTDTGVDLIGFISTDMARNIARVTDNAYVNGDGSSTEPLGIADDTGGLTIGVTGATGNTGIPTFDELIDLKYSIEQMYLPESCWLMNHTTIGEVAKIKDDDGRYLWQESRQINEPDMILGAPVKNDPHVAETGLDAKSVYFGNFREAVIIRDVGGLQVARTNLHKFDTDKTTFRIIARTDSKIINANAAKVFKGGAS